jgi:uncharacterized protein YkwD
MFVRRSRIFSPLLAVVVLAGCGGSSTRPAAAPAPDQQGPAASGLRVGATDLRLGDASLADRDGVRRLRVPHRRVDADALRRSRAPRQGVGAGESCTDVEVMPDGANTATVIAATLCLINGERADAGLPPLTENARLASAALEHSEDMVAKQYFAHEALDGQDIVDRVRAAGYLARGERWTVGENLAWGTGTLATPRGIVSAWMNSQGHRENILRASFREIGFGVVTGNPRVRDGAGATYTTAFGAVGNGRTVAAAPPAAAPPATETQPVASVTPPKARRSAIRAQKRKASARRRARQARLHAQRAHATALRQAKRTAIAGRKR